MTTKEQATIRYGLYWKIWLILLGLTLVMILLDQSPIPRAALVMMLVVAMLAKACLVAGYFMHLRFERLALTLGVALGLLFTASALFFLIMPDGFRILELAGR